MDFKHSINIYGTLPDLLDAEVMDMVIMMTGILIVGAPPKKGGNIVPEVHMVDLDHEAILDVKYYLITH